MSFPLAVASESKKFILGALTLITALAWNQAFRSVLEQHPEFQVYGVWIYAFALTVLSVFIASVMSKITVLQPSGKR